MAASLFGRRIVVRYLVAAVLTVFGVWLRNAETPGLSAPRQFMLLTRRIVYGRPDRPLEAARAADLVLDEAGRCLRRPGDPAGTLRQVQASFERMLPPDARADPYENWYASLRLTGGTWRDRVAVAVNYGCLSRVAVFERRTGRRVPLDGGVLWNEDQAPAFTPDGTLVLFQSLSEFANLQTVQTYRAGPDGYRRQWQLEYDADSESYRPSLVGDTLTIASMDEPQSFRSGGLASRLRRERVFRIADGRAFLLRNVALDAELRFLDAWLAKANDSRTPSPLQRRARWLVGRSWSLEYVRIRPLRRDRLEVGIGGGSVRAYFVLRRRRNTFDMQSVDVR